MGPEAKLKELGIDLPDIPKPLGSYLPYVQTGNLVFISGMLPLKEGRLISAGIVGSDITQEEAAAAARTSAINGLAVLRSALGSLDLVKRCVKITVYVASAPGFIAQPVVANGASDLLFAVFDEKGRHARAAVGVNLLPMNSPVEIELVFEAE
jgi:enamine deaminase RidA (YjgF/YER057c/UK114 family)